VGGTIINIIISHQYHHQQLETVVTIQAPNNARSCSRLIIIIMLPNQAIASTPSAPRPSGAEGPSAAG
jgi:hypothetical protein